MTKEHIRTIVVDDHHLFRSGIVALLNNTPFVDIIGEASDGLGALDLLQSNTTDIAILDLDMPQMNGLEACKLIKQRHPNVSILILSWHCEAAQIKQLMESGAKGFLVKDCTKDELQTAVKVMAQGGSYFSQPITELIFELNSTKRNTVTQGEAKQTLTSREQEILECIANEYTNKEIAHQLFISQRTVETHRRNLIQKLQVKNTVGLVKYYFQRFSFSKQALRINT